MELFDLLQKTTQGRLVRGVARHPFKDLGDLGPGRFLAVIDLAQIEQMPLHPTPPRPHLLGDAPVTMILPVFKPVMTLQKWFGHHRGCDRTSTAASQGRGQVCTKPIFETKLPHLPRKLIQKMTENS